MPIKIKLRDMMDRYRRRTGRRLTYSMLAEMTDLSQSAIRQIASNPKYNPTLDTIGRLCAALECQPGDLLVYSPRIVRRG